MSRPGAPRSADIAKLRQCHRRVDDVAKLESPNEEELARCVALKSQIPRTPRLRRGGRQYLCRWPATLRVKLEPYIRPRGAHDQGARGGAARHNEMFAAFAGRRGRARRPADREALGAHRTPDSLRALTSARASRSTSIPESIAEDRPRSARKTVRGRRDDAIEIEAARRGRCGRDVGTGQT